MKPPHSPLKKPRGPLRQGWGIVSKVLAGSTNIVARAIGGGTLVLILFLKRWPRVPGILIGVVAATVIVAAFDLARRAGVSVLGPLPQGLPSPCLPFIGMDELVPWSWAEAVALIFFADTSVLSRAYAARLRTPVDPNQNFFPTIGEAVSAYRATHLLDTVDSEDREL